LSGTLQADNASGQGGKVVVQGQNILLDKGSSITATGGQGGGEVYIGGGWQGKDSSIRNADNVVMKDGARIDVSATQQGNGGTAVLWSESFTNFRGQISAKGGENGGNGGQVETSSHGNLQAFGSVSASAKKGKAGNWLLDPLDITIVENAGGNAANETEENGEKIFSPGSTTQSQVSNTSINNELNNGTSVTILTNSTTSGSDQKGNITVNADINKTSGTDATLTLKADGNINVNKNITSTAGKLNVNLAAANTSSTGTITLGNNVSITTNGGDITAGTANASNSVTINVTGTTLNTSSGSQAGNITLNGSRVNVTNANITAGNFTLNATANGADLNNVTLMATHDIILTGNSTNGTGLQLKGTNTLNATNGSISLTGNSTNGTGIDLLGTNTLTATSGTISFNGKSGKSRGINISGTSNILNATEINLTGSSTGAEGIDISGSSTLTATSGNISLNGTTQSQWYGVRIQGSNITATNGSISLTGNSTNGTGLFLGGNKTLRASNGNINLTGNSQKGVGLYLGERNNTSTLTATNGSINLNGVSETKSAIEIRGYNTLTADNINLTGNSTNGTGIDLDGNNSWTAANITITGCSSHTGLDTQGSWMGKGVHLHGDLTFTGNVAINGTANAGAGVGLSAKVNMTFNNGTAVINGTSTGIDISNGISNKVIYGAGVADVVLTGENTQKNITLLNSNLTINGHSHNAAGIAGWSDVKYEETTKWNISGNGNITINASSVEYDGFQNVVINASGLNGTTTLHGTSTNGSGVYLENMNMTNV
ncbi:TPA: S-layer family protein, partial [Escherichia coli]|nr:S-layer family protein [Escherichia coli]